MTSPNTNTNSASTISEDGALSNATLITTVATNASTTWSTNLTEGGYDYELVDGTDSRYECPICLLCLRDPVLTTCGHRFCSSCINQWVIKENGKCPVDSVSLSHENIFPDNYTRREIMASMAKCPYSKSSCTTVLPIAELEKHVQIEHSNSESGPLVNGDGRPTPPTSNGLLECPYKEVGCAIPLRQDQFRRHLDMDVHHHLALLMAAYRRLKIHTSRPNLEPWLLDEGGMSMSVDDYQFRRQRSWDSVRFARKHNIRPSTSHNLGSQSVNRLPESEESLCNPYCEKGELQKGEKGFVQGASGGADPHLQDIFQRLVLLEQKDQEKQIKIEKLESELATMMNLFGSSTQMIKDFTSRYCHGMYVWKIPNFRKQCWDMRKNPNKVLNSPGFYTDTFGYKLCLRINLTTPSSSAHFGGEGACAHPPIDIPLEHDEDTHLSLVVHFMQGEFDDTLHWPFQGEIQFTVIHPSNPEYSIIEVMDSNPNIAAFFKPTLPRNPKGFGYVKFCEINKIFANGFVKDDMLVCKVLAKSSLS